MCWAGVTLYDYGIPINGRRIKIKWFDDDEFFAYSGCWDEDD